MFCSSSPGPVHIPKRRVFVPATKWGHRWLISPFGVSFFVTSSAGPPLSFTRQMPLLLAGGGARSLQMGRRIKVNDDCPPERWWCDAPTLVPHNKVLVSIAQAFGQADVTAFGNPELESGPLSGL